MVFEGSITLSLTVESRDQSVQDGVTSVKTLNQTFIQLLNCKPLVLSGVCVDLYIYSLWCGRKTTFTC